MQTKNIENDLLNLERQYWQAMKDKDIEAMNGLTDYPCIVTGAQGVASLDRMHLEGMMKTAAWTLEDFKLDDDAEVRVLSDDVATIAYKVHEKLTVDGKPVTLDAADASVWVRRDGKWLCAMHTESLSGDPYGRDRRAAH